jgi:3-oxoacyl-[acyl-carrier protein] reductase
MSPSREIIDAPGPLAGRTALITGAPRSIGRAITEALARDGANIVVHYRSRKAEADELAELLKSRGYGGQ